MKHRTAFYVLLVINVIVVLASDLMVARWSSPYGMAVTIVTLCVTGTWVALLVLIANSLPPRPDI